MAVFVGADNFWGQKNRNPSYLMYFAFFTLKSLDPRSSLGCLIHGSGVRASAHKHIRKLCGTNTECLTTQTNTQTQAPCGRASTPRNDKYDQCNEIYSSTAHQEGLEHAALTKYSNIHAHTHACTRAVRAGKLTKTRRGMTSRLHRSGPEFSSTSKKVRGANTDYSNIRTHTRTCTARADKQTKERRSTRRRTIRVLPRK